MSYCWAKKAYRTIPNHVGKKGIFKIKKDLFIVRIYKDSYYRTVGKFKTESEAKKCYESYL